MAEHSLDDLFTVLVSRRDAATADSYTARLLSKGPGKIAKKVGEEGVEAALAGACGEREELIAESADLLYHLLVLWIARDVTPQEVWDKLAERAGTSGLAEKASRPAD